jgi:hypothetical protein
VELGGVGEALSGAAWQEIRVLRNPWQANCVVFIKGDRIPGGADEIMIKFLLWCILFILCWPVAVMAILLYPIVWLILLPFRLAGIAVHGALELVVALISLPVRMLRAI